MKKVIWSLCCLCLTTLASAQPFPQQEIRRIIGNTDANKIETVKQLVQLPDGYLLLAGTWQDSAFVMKVNEVGDKIWHRTFNPGTKSTFAGVVSLSNGDIIALGSCDSCLVNDGAKKAIIYKLNEAGDSLDFRISGPVGFDKVPTALAKDESDQIIIVGRQVVTTAFSLRDIFVERWDANLMMLDSAGIHKQAYDDVSSIEPTDGNYFLLAGSSLASLVASRKGELFKVNADLDTVWTRQLPGAAWLFDAKISDQGEIYTVGRSTLISGETEGYLAKLDSNGQLLLDTTYGGSGNDELYTVHIGQEGQRVMAGGLRFDSPQEDHGQRAWILYLNANLEQEQEIFRSGVLSHFSVGGVLPFSDDLEDIILGLNRTGFSFGDIIFQRVHTIGHKMRFNKMPQYHELYPRDRTSNTGSVSIQGYALLNESDYEAVEINIFRERELLESTLLNLTYNNDTANFSYTHELPAELTNYHFKVYGIKNGVPHFEAEALNVVAGDVYLIDGGSNAAAVVLYDPADTIPHAYRYDRNPFIRNYGLKYADENSYVWHSEADDDAPFASFRSGQWGLRLGRNIVENQQIPIAIINGSASVASIEYLQPNWQNPTDTASNYGRLLTRVRNARLENHIRAILFFQGETDGWYAAFDSLNATDQTNIYKNKWLDLHNAWQLHYPGFESTYLFQTRPGCFTGPDWGGITPEQNILGNLKIMEAQRQLAEEIETVQIMSSGGMNHFGCLFGYINGYERAGDDIYRLLAKDLYDSGAGLAIYPPTVASVSMMENEPDQLLLTFQHPEDELIITSGLEHHFRLEGSLGIEILSLQATENGVRLQLSNVPEPGFTGLSYAPYPASNESPVKNERGIGLLGFYNKPVIITNIIEPSLASGAVKVYPNPTLGGSAIYLEVKAGFELNALELYGAGGSLVYIKNFTHPAEGNIRITPQVDSGVYHLKIKLSNEQIISKKIIIH